jgi:hypothetical protein
LRWSKTAARVSSEADANADMDGDGGHGRVEHDLGQRGTQSTRGLTFHGDCRRHNAEADTDRGRGDDLGQRGTCRGRRLRAGAARGEEGADGVGLEVVQDGGKGRLGFHRRLGFHIRRWRQDLAEEEAGA